MLMTHYLNIIPREEEEEEETAIKGRRYQDVYARPPPHTHKPRSRMGYVSTHTRARAKKGEAGSK